MLAHRYVSSVSKGRMRILAVGDSFMPPRYFAEAFTGLDGHEIELAQVDEANTIEPVTPSERRAARVPGLAGGADRADARHRGARRARRAGHGRRRSRRRPSCASSAARAAGRSTSTSSARQRARAPAREHAGEERRGGRRPDARVPRHARARAARARSASWTTGNRLKDNWEGAKFIGSDLRRHTLGLVGYGQVGRRVAQRALPFGMTVLAYDPYRGRRRLGGAGRDPRRAARAVRLRLAARARRPRRTRT